MPMEFTGLTLHHIGIVMEWDNIILTKHFSQVSVCDFFLNISQKNKKTKDTIESFLLS